MTTSAKIIVLVGDADACSRRERWYRDAFLQKYGEHAPIELLDAEESNRTDLQGILFTPSLFSEKRMVVVRGLPVSSTAKGKELLAIEEFFASQLKHLDEQAVYILVSPQADKRKSFYKTCNKAGYIEECVPKQGAALYDLIEQLAPGKIPRSLQSHLIGIVHEEEAALRSAVEKVVLYAGADPIDEAMLEHVLTTYEEPNIFTLMDGLSEKSLQKSIHALQVLVKGGEDLFMVLSMCMRQFRILYLLRAANDRDAMAKQLKLHPFVAKKTMQYVTRFSPEELQGFYDQLLAIDEAIKTGGIRTSTDDVRELQTALELFITNACVGSGKAGRVQG